MCVISAADTTLIAPEAALFHTYGEKSGLDRCIWSTPDNPKLLDPFLIPHIPGLMKCLTFNAEKDQVTDEIYDPITTAAFAPWGDKIVAGSRKGTLWVEDLSHHRILQAYENFQTGPIRLLAFQGHRLIAQTRDEAPRVFGEAIVFGDANLSSPTYVSRALSPNSEQLRYYKNETLILSGPHGSWPLNYQEGGDSLWQFSLDSRWLATIGRDRKPLAWHLDVQGKPSSATTFSSRYTHSARVTALTLSADGHWLVSGDEIGAVRLWDLQSPGADPVALVNHRGPVNALAFNLSGHLLATAGDDGIVRLSKITDGQAPRVLPNSPGNRGEPITAIAFLSDDRLAIGSQRSRVLLWKPKKEVFLDDDTVGIRELVSSPDGIHLAARTGYGVRIWYSTDHDSSPLESVDLVSPMDQIIFTSDGTHLEGNKLGEISHLELRIDNLLKTACKAAGRNLTEREWKGYIPSSEPYKEREPCPEFPKAYD